MNVLKLVTIWIILTQKIQNLKQKKNRFEKNSPIEINLVELEKKTFLLYYLQKIKVNLINVRWVMSVKKKIKT